MEPKLLTDDEKANWYCDLYGPEGYYMDGELTPEQAFRNAVTQYNEWYANGGMFTWQKAMEAGHA